MFLDQHSINQQIIAPTLCLILKSEDTDWLITMLILNQTRKRIQEHVLLVEIMLSEYAILNIVLYLLLREFVLSSLVNIMFKPWLQLIQYSNKYISLLNLGV